MKKNVLIIVLVLAALVIFTTVALADKPVKTDAEGNEIAWEKSSCTTIQSGTLYGSDGLLLTTGYNEWGYNYQAHMFNGNWCDYHATYRPGGANYDWCQANMSDVELMMKWSDTWLSNVDCNDDGKLDRGYSCDPVNASSSGCVGAWLTNHERGTYVSDNGQTCSYEYFVKIVAPPADAYKVGDYWYTVDGTEIGEVIWTAYAIVQTVNNDPCAGAHGIEYLSPDHPGLGGWQFIQTVSPYK